MTTTQRTKVFGRSSRLLIGLILLGVAIPFLIQRSFSLFLPSLGVAGGLFIFYLLVHLVVVRFFPTPSQWVGLAIANVPAGLVFLLGLPGGWILGQGEGFLGAALYVGVSLLFATLRADPGCEVMTLPALIFGKHANLACAVFTPIDIIEKKLHGE